ncbi:MULTISPECIES: MerR family transcriptional regulator [Paenibacillus]|uniref:MerR family transcriptional regulator n=1 Tax=Paenibacillus TaxID=44249 RepID=UPI00048BC5F5|nr:MULTISPECIES: MerR family transcriptional regulator [Paenibacillus]GIO88953.1 hypothetical protein J31TS3_01800 [Paenibacillus lactis]
MGKKYSVKEISQLSGVTPRTVQYYDNEGILKAERDESGHRVYYEKQLYLLEQIMFFRAIGFSLSKIKEQLIVGTEVKDIERILDYQASVLYSQKESIQAKLDGLHVAKELMSEGYEVPWELLSHLMRSLDEVDMSTWGEYEYSEEDLRLFQEVFDSEQAALDFYNRFRKISLQAAAYNASGVPVESELARTLAKEWQGMVRHATQGDERILSAFTSVDHNRDRWNAGERRLIIEAEEYLQEVLKRYPDDL